MPKIPSPQIKAEAAAWLAHLRADNRSDADERAFHKWISADASHAAAFEMMTAIWEDAGALPKKLLRDFQEQPSPWLDRRKVLAGLSTLAVVGGGAYWQSAQADIYRTDVGEQKHIVLKDGTQVFLDTNTCIAVAFSETKRSMNLQYGRVNLRVAPDAEHCFFVNAANHRIETSNSYFDVRRDADEVSVVLICGQASVKSEASSVRNKTETLNAGQQLLASATESMKVVKANLPILLAWQKGQVIFENKALAGAVYEMNRYSTSKLKIIDDRISNFRMSGVYSVGDNTAFADSIARLLPIKARFIDGDIELFADDPRIQEG